ncbi:hypothetical protein CK203_009935 [Vitis vinifera]|uniref:Uncharacterized protein n=1 Tax=Vitis vinifera TaxID=29760 RepID=A0A438JUX0_VITVI|nr:hypothetical protein CK203_009935 [Vitis vinifera]
MLEHVRFVGEAVWRVSFLKQQAPNSFVVPQLLVPGYLDCIFKCFIPSPTSLALLPINSYLVGGLGQNYYPCQRIEAN